MGRERRNVKMEMVGGKGLKFKNLKNKGHGGSETAHPSVRPNVDVMGGSIGKKENACKTKHRKKL